MTPCSKTKPPLAEAAWAALYIIAYFALLGLIAYFSWRIH
jgi:hypothetical protein